MLFLLASCVEKPSGKVEIDAATVALMAITSTAELTDIKEDQESVTKVDLGELPLNTRVTQTITITHDQGRLPLLKMIFPTLESPDIYFHYLGGAFPGAGGNCGNRIEPGNSCTIVVEYYPKVEGAHTEPFNINYSDGIDNKVKKLLLRGASGMPAVLTINEAESMHDFGFQQPMTVHNTLLTVHNSGGLTAKEMNLIGLGGAINFAGGSYPGTGGDCNRELEYDESCTIAIAYTPQEDAVSQKIVTLEYSFFGSEETTNFTLKGSAFYARGTISANKTSHFFQERIWLKNDATTVTYTNNGYGASTVRSLSFSTSSNNPFSIETSDSNNPTTCTVGLLLQIGESCKVRLKFTPPELTDDDITNNNGGSYENTFRLYYNNGEYDVSGPVGTNLYGDGLVPAKLQILYAGNEVSETESSVNGLNFGSRGIFETVVRTFTVKNRGGSTAEGIDLVLNNLRDYSLTPASDEVNTICETLHDDALEASGGSTGFTPGDPPGCYTGFTVQGNSCSGTLYAGDTCNIQIKLKAMDSSWHILSDDSSFQNEQEANRLLGLKPITIDYNNGESGKQVKLHVKGFGEGRPVIEWYPLGFNQNPSIIYQFPADLKEDSNYTIDSNMMVPLYVKNVGTDPALNVTSDLPFGSPPNWDYKFRYATSGTVIDSETVVTPFTIDNDLNITSGAGAFVDGQICPKNIPAKGECFVYLEMFEPDPGYFTDDIELTYVQNATENAPSTGVGNVSTSGTVVTLEEGVSWTDVPDPANDVAIDAGDKITIDGQTRWVERIDIENNKLYVYSHDPFDPDVSAGFTYIKSNARYQAELDYSVSVKSLGYIRPSTTHLNFSEVDPAEQKTTNIWIRNEGYHTVTNVVAEIIATSGGTFTIPAYPGHNTRTDQNSDYYDCRQGVGNQSFSSLGGSNHGYCRIPVRFVPDSVGNHEATLRLTYDDSLNVSVTKEITIVGEGKEMANIVFQENGALLPESPKSAVTRFDFGNTIIGQTSSYTFLLTNTGSLAATRVEIGGFRSAYSIDTSPSPAPSPAACTGTVSGNNFDIDDLAPAASCTITIVFETAERGLKQISLSFTYRDTVKTNNASYIVKGYSKSAANLSILPSPQYDFGRVVIGDDNTKAITIKNNGDTSTSISSANYDTISDADYSISSDQCNGKTLAYRQSCTITMQFAPTDINVDHTETFEVSYATGVGTSASRSYDLLGYSAPPDSTHRGWVKLRAFGDLVDVSNAVVTDSSYNEIEWEAMTPPSGYTFDHYNVYRASSPSGFDLDSPITPAEGVAVSSRVYQDLNVTEGEVYYYKVLPVIQGAYSMANATDSAVRIITPQENMALMHRWMVNQDVCEMINSTSDRNNNWRCSYYGPGGSGGYFDLGYDLLVDRFEIGSDGTNRFDQRPIDSSIQEDAWNSCQNTVVSLGGSNYSKRLMRRKEYVAAASWESDLLSPTTTLNKLEKGQPTGSYPSPCNGSEAGAGSTQNTGAQLDCVSRYGIYDLVGNIAEFTSERMSAGTQSDDYPLDSGNNDLNGHEFNYTASEYVQPQDAECFNFVFGMPKNKSQGSCYMSSDVSTHGSYFHSYDGIFTPLSFPEQLVFIPLNGGSYDSESYSGRWSVDWLLGLGGTGGYRCAVPYSY
jgi:hypothetical protein